MSDLRSARRDRKDFCLAWILCLLVLCSCTSDQVSNSQSSTRPELQGAEQNKPGVKCSEDSPERRGEEGCTILANRSLSGSLAKPVYWHIDRFDSLEAATRAAGPDGVAAEAHGSVWLMTVEAQIGDHNGGQHVSWIGPLTLPRAESYTMRVQSSLLLPGAATPVHTHSGPEVFYILEGEQCLETQEVGHRLGTGQTFVLPGDVIHRGRVTVPDRRRALALIVYDAARPASSDLSDPPPLVPCTP